MVALCSGGSEESVPEMEIGDTRGGIVGCSGGTRDVGCLGLRRGTEQTRERAGGHW